MTDLNPCNQVAMGKRFYQEASGTVMSYLIDQPGAVRLNFKANAGDPTAARIMRSIGAWAARVFSKEVPEAARPKCLACDVAFKHESDPGALVCTTPMAGSGPWVVIAGMCKRCAESGAHAKAADAWRREWPSSTVISMVG